MALNPIRDLDTAGFEAEVLRAAGPVLVDFWAEWCPPCRMIEPVVTELASTHSGQLLVGRLDIDSCPEIGIRYAVLGLPTLILFVGGQPVDRLVGFSRPRPRAPLGRGLDAGGQTPHLADLVGRGSLSFLAE